MALKDLIDSSNHTGLWKRLGYNTSPRIGHVFCRNLDKIPLKGHVSKATEKTKTYIIPNYMI